MTRQALHSVGTYAIALALLPLSLFYQPLSAQRNALLSTSDSPASASLDDVLNRLQEDLTLYRRSVPDLFCDEHVVSSREEQRTHAETVTDSTFRLRKTRHEDNSFEFDESRILRAVDGKTPLQGTDRITGPTILIGVFSYGLDVVSRDLAVCYAYTLHPPRPGHPKDRIVVDYRNLPREDRAVTCPPFERTSGRATIDPLSMHIVRLEKTTPDTRLPLNQTGMWKWTVEYAPVQVAGKTFWMPKTIQSTSTTTDGQSTWIFKSRYTNYHLFHAESRIVPIAP